MNQELKTEGNFKFVETKGGNDNLLLLHGLFGQLSNFEGIIEKFSSTHNVIVPILPIFDMPIRKISVKGLLDHVIEFVDFKQYQNLHVLGNSLGGHITLLFALARPELISSLILTGSSGLFESAMGSTFPKRGDKQYIRDKVQATFYDPNIATEEMIEEVFETTNSRNKAIRIIATAKSAIRHNLGDKLHQIKAPTLLIWGKQDSVTPPFVAEKFHELIADSRLIFVDKCGHAPMMEQPEIFNDHLAKFLEEVTVKVGNE